MGTQSIQNLLATFQSTPYNQTQRPQHYREGRIFRLVHIGLRAASQLLQMIGDTLGL